MLKGSRRTKHVPELHIKAVDVRAEVAKILSHRLGIEWLGHQWE